MYYFPFFLVRKCEGKGHIFRIAKKIGHRGCRLDGIPENSIASFKHALKHEMDVLELDVWITKDSEVVVFHDKTMGRMTGKLDGQCISDLFYTELPPLRTDIPGQCEQISLYEKDEVSRIPKLEEVLDLLPKDKAMNIEVKQDSHELFQKVVDLVSKKGKKHQVFWFSLEEKINKKLRAFDPSIPNIVSVEGFLKNMALYYLGLIPFTNIPEQVYGITIEKVSVCTSFDD
jgi:glycerophosphoryl diester phosphodiesterase